MLLNVLYSTLIKRATVSVIVTPEGSQSSSELEEDFFAPGALVLFPVLLFGSLVLFLDLHFFSFLPPLTNFGFNNFGADVLDDFILGADVLDDGVLFSFATTKGVFCRIVALNWENPLVFS